METETEVQKKGWICGRLVKRRCSTTDERTGQRGRADRDNWSNSAEYLLSLLGYAVGVGNILRFPYIALRNGGGAFLIAYFLSLFISGIPLVMLETYMGQKAQKSCIACWDSFVPLLKGAGFSMTLMSAVFSLVYQPIVAWVLYYMAMSLQWTLPWTSCNQTWNTQNCVSTVDDVNATDSIGELLLRNTSSDWLTNITGHPTNWTYKPMSAAEEYWQYNVLQLSNSIHNVGSINWKLCICHVFGQIAIFLCLIKGVKSVGRVVWVTAIGPYLLIIVFVIRAAMLPGSLDGLKFYMTADLSALADPETWLLAFLQIFYSLGVGWGAFHTMASFNKPNHNFIREAFFVPIATALTSFVSGFVIFSCAGFLALKSGISVTEAMAIGPGVAFVSYPEVTAHLPAGPVWSFLFFLMLFMVVLDTFFVSIEVSVSSVSDEFGISKKYHKLVLLLVTIFNIFGGLIFYTQAGMYIFQLLDWYASALLSFLVATVELVSLTWIYGHKRVLKDIEIMTGARIGKFILVPLWGVVLPCLLLLAMGWSVSKLSVPNYGDYIFPAWSSPFGWSLAVVMVLPIFIYIVVQCVSFFKRSEKKRFQDLLRPKIEIPSTEEEDSSECVDKV